MIKQVGTLPYNQRKNGPNNNSGKVKGNCISFWHFL